MQKNMRNDWFCFKDLDGGNPFILPTEIFFSRSLRDHLFSKSKHRRDPGSLALNEAFSCISKFAGAFLFWFTSGSSSNLSRRIAGTQNVSKPGSCKPFMQVEQITSSDSLLAGFNFSSSSKSDSATSVAFSKISNSLIRRMLREGEGIQSCFLLSLATAVIPPLDNISSKIMAVPLDATDVRMHDCVEQRPCEVEPQHCGSLSFSNLNRRRHAVEPKTGIEFPVILDNMLDTGHNSSLTSEVLVGTGSRTMKIIKIKSLKVYAFGFYVHPHAVCEKLGRKYASIPVGNLNNRHEFYEDLLREDIDMTVRLVINCNGVKIDSVKDAFEKSLRARLVKTNPDTDYSCLKTFGSYFTKDILLPQGTTIDLRRTADGQLITEIGGNRIGAVKSKDLCRAFFDMYLGDVPVSEQTKEEIGKNVVSMIRKC
ncbi:fatty-acid-binding protein 2 [Mangifera indica]|uniref:fatty-acid-binding protein 2 n=1 Tax=Mangifera indica TaxID=29780 RepID=UPI001CF9ED32|nr:fatty-acid-binding protein 2 [Mangifera indica]